MQPWGEDPVPPPLCTSMQKVPVIEGNSLFYECHQFQDDTWGCSTAEIVFCSAVGDRGVGIAVIVIMRLLGFSNPVALLKPGFRV